MSTARKLDMVQPQDVPAELLPVKARYTGIAQVFENKRFGRHLEINVLGEGAKVCSFNCGYCDLGATSLRLNKIKGEVSFPQPEAVGQAVSDALRDLCASGAHFDRLLISGNGEPTLHPEFPEVARHILAARDQWFPNKPVAILTNGAMLDTRKIAEAMNKLDERIVKIDVGNEKLFKAVNSPLSRSTLMRVLSAARSLKDVIVQSMFVQGAADNTGHSDIDDWIEVVAMMRPKSVQIHTIRHVTALSGLRPCDEDTLYTIASRLERRTQIKATVTD